MKTRTTIVLLTVLIGGALGLAAATPTSRATHLAPMSAETKIVSSHAAYESGDCAVCHESADPAKPGKIKAAANQLCLECHDDYRAVLGRPFVHAAASNSCGNCHNPHNSAQPKLLVDDLSDGCLSCHEQVKGQVQHSKVAHGAVTSGSKCVSCHNPHGTEVEHLLTDQPANLCLSCHDRDDVADHTGKNLTNLKRLLAENPRQHSPVASGDCSACHNPHGYDNFRLLTKDYPANFYAGFKAENYALCFDCHEERMITDKETTTQTKFRDGRRNLHYLHVNKSDRGRTCRACHEVHAAKQKGLIRDAVPYGQKNWMLKLNFTRTDTGGTCTKTCHATQSYNNTPAALLPKP